MDDRLPFADVRVVEVGDRRGAYAGRLLADLGADVVRLQPADARPGPPPYVDGPDGEISATAWFQDLNKRVVEVDVLAEPEALLGELESADVLIESFRPGELAEAGLGLEVLRGRRPELIVVSVTPFGQTGPWAGYEATDLISLAAGGLLWLGGYPDTPPIAAFGGQSEVAAGIFAAIASILALISRRRDGVARWMDVSAQEAVVQALEDSIPEYDLNGTTRRRLGDQRREAGTGIFPCADGYINIVAGRLGTAKAWIALTEWLGEEGVEGAEELCSEKWRDFGFRRRPEAVERFREVFTGFTKTRTKYELYLEGQRRSIALGPVNTVDDLFRDGQLEARGFWRKVETPLGEIRFPGPPYRIDGGFGGPSPRLAVREKAPPAPGSALPPIHTNGSGAAPSMKGLFADLRVLDYCWIGAGALVTKVLAEHGAEVIKIESRKRPDNLRLAPPYRGGVEHIDGSGYFASRNPNKRSFSLDMSHPEGPALARRLVEKVDIVTNNFRPGVMERWGMSYADLRAINPSLIYLSMPMQGQTGPHKSFIGFGSTLASLGGLVGLSGLPDHPPVGTGTHYPDHIPNPGHALVALCAAIYNRELTGAGMEIELSQFESTVNVIGPAVVARAAGGPLLERAGNRSALACPSGAFPCVGEDQWCAIAVTGEEGWRATADVLGRPEWAEDARFRDFAARKANEDELESELAGLTVRFDKWELMRALQERGVAAAAVEDSGDLVGDPHLGERGFWKELDHAVMGHIVAAGLPFGDAEGAPAGPTRPAPLLGEHTVEIAESVLDMDGEEFDRLVAEGVLR
ncbi:MAG TPA: CoA transferase [Solirubrobacterales bacterium]|nr:CoA transferase [Solirubrobacterales bacterium]